MITGWAHVTLSVRDHDRSVGWYETVLGFKPTATETTDQWKRTLCVHPASGIILVLHQHLLGGGEFDERRAGLDHLALSVADRTDLDAWQDRLAALGVSYTPITGTGRGGLAIAFPDPDGIALELFYRPQNAPPRGVPGDAEGGSR
ncbi:VOC family protein [Nonomuraea helvata]|uniref:VOC family protein n=1 Tax=Nonomuraea helvata TaxID=37484 RepID=A0ABV5S2K6_9ACTN